MKKTILSLCTLLSCASFFTSSATAQDTLINPSLEYLRVATSVGYESKYVFRGEEFAKDSIQTKVDFAYPLATDTDFYIGAWANAPMSRGNNDEFTEVDAYAGITFAYESLVFDAGYIYYWYTDLQPIEDRTQEVYLGVTWDTSAYLGLNLNPSLYYFYNATLNQHTVEVSMSYTADVGYYISGLSSALTMPIRVYSGWLTTANFEGTLTWDDLFNIYNTLGEINLSNDYWYVGASIDLAYDLTEYCKISVGARISYTQGDTRYNGEAKTFFWSGARVDFGF